MGSVERPHSANIYLSQKNSFGLTAQSDAQKHRLSVEKPDFFGRDTPLDAQDLLRTQLPGKPAEAPFELAVACLRKIDIFAHPEVLIAAFRLKLLAVEGVPTARA